MLKSMMLSTQVTSASPQEDAPIMDPDDNQEVIDEPEPQETTRTQESTPSTAISPYNLSTTAASFQNLLRTRRTTSKFRTSTLTDEDDNNTENLLTAEQYRAALHRAVLAGRAAPNHKRTEPFSFRRLVGPTPATERLADIAQQVYLRSRKDTTADPAMVVAAAQRKRDKWSQVPAFLVTLVFTTKPGEDSNNNDFTPIATTANDQSLYDPLPFQPPTCERALEDYAAACAATQNVLLSLHSEGLASKWATGPVIQTPAFRDLIQAGPEDRVVALIMIGQAPPTMTTSQRPRRFHRSLEGDVLRDI